MRTERGHDRVLPVPGVLLSNRDDPVEPCTPALREADGLHPRHRAGHRLLDDRLPWHPHEHEVLIEPAHDDVEDRVIAVVHAVHDEDGLLPNAVIRPDRVDEGPLGVTFVGQPAFEHILRIRRDREPALDLHRADTGAERAVLEGGRDPHLVHPVLDGGPAADEAPGVQADAHGDLQLLTRPQGLLVHVVQMPGHDPARAASGIQDQDSMERQVPLPLPLRDPYPRRDVATRVLREQLRDGRVDEIDVRGLILQKPGRPLDLEVDRM